MKKTFLTILLLFGVIAYVNGGEKISQDAEQTDRQYWIETMLKIVSPVFENLSNNTLRLNMPVETSEGLNTGKLSNVAHLEALGRSFCGISPWLNLPIDDTEEGKARAEYTKVVLKAIENALNPSSPDYLPFDGPTKQPLVDAAFFAHGLLRSKDAIWPKLSTFTKERIIQELKNSRKIVPHESNWLMFSAMTEAALLHFTGECEMAPIEYAISRHKEWYKGDGWYGDGPPFHFDYYNSFVIQPMLTDVLYELKNKGLDSEISYDVQLKRMIDFAGHLERLISPEGSFPVIGRSMAYRFGAFQALSQIALMRKLPSDIQPAQIRCALTAVIKRQLVPETFDKDGWLVLGFCGHQPEIADYYISTGSLYLCSSVFLPLGLPADDSFWADPPTEWSSKRIWSGR